MVAVLKKIWAKMSWIPYSILILYASLILIKLAEYLYVAASLPSERKEFAFSLLFLAFLWLMHKNDQGWKERILQERASYEARIGRLIRHEEET
jgi:hypothetical protein